MSQLKFYKYATWALLFLNIAVLGFFLLTKPRPPHHPAPNDFQLEVIKILDLNDQQVSTFRRLAKEHNQKMNLINEQQRTLLPPYFESLSDPSKIINEDTILSQFQQLEREKIEVTYQHFQDLKSMLDASQLPYFEQLMGKFINELLLGQKKNSPPPKDLD